MKQWRTCKLVSWLAGSNPKLLCCKAAHIYYILFGAGQVCLSFSFPESTCLLLLDLWLNQSNTQNGIENSVACYTSVTVTCL